MLTRTETAEPVVNRALLQQDLSLCTCALAEGESCPLDVGTLEPDGSLARFSPPGDLVGAPALTLCKCSGKIFPREVEAAGRSEQLAAPSEAAPTTKCDRGAHGCYKDSRHRRRYVALVAGLALAAVVVITLILGWGNPFPVLSEKWWRISGMRFAAVAVIVVVTFAQSYATVAFQTVTNNRIITPSIMGFESLFVLVQTSIIYFLGASQLVGSSSIALFLLQVGVMVGFAVALYSWLLSGKFGNLHVMLLVGIVIGTGLGAISTFMQRMLEPSEFDVLRAKLFGNIGNAKTELLPIAIPLVIAAGVAIWLLSGRLNILSLGEDVATNLGVNHRRQTMTILTLVSVLMAVSTALVGPMTFLGFLTATLAYSAANTYDHKRILPVAWLLGIVVLGAAYFALKHVFSAVDAVMIVVELVGGTAFLALILRRGRL